MAKSKEFELVPRRVPVRQRSSLYKQIVTEFLAIGEPSVQIAGTDRRPATLVQGLRKAVQSEGTDGVRVVQRGQDVYLLRT
ncbi:MAG: hypothetical protein LLG45_09750 [Actinomycetia bacterium]|nr:hypothetical protein [Actinomycetes bacterium]